MNGPYQVVLRLHAQRDLKRLPQSAISQIQNALAELSSSPRAASNTKKLKAAKGIYRKRTGNYRILYEIDDQNRQVIIHRIGDRKDIYR